MRLTTFGFRVLSNPAISVLLTGRFVSRTGDQIFVMSSLWMAYELTHSTVAMSGVEVASLLAVLVVGNFGGFLTDGLYPLIAMICLDVFCALVLLSIPLMYFTGHLDLWSLIGTNVLLTGASLLFSPALQGLIPQLTTRDELGQANGMLDLTSRLSKMMGPGIFGAVITLVPLVHLFTLDAITYLTSSMSLVYVRIQVYKKVTASPPTIRKSTRSIDAFNVSSWNLLLKTPWLRTVTFTRSLNNGLWALYSIGSPLFIKEHFSSGIRAWGLILSAYGLGQVVGNTVSVRLSSSDNSLKSFSVGWFIIGLSFMGYALSPTLLTGVVSIFLAGVGGPIAHVPANTRIGLDIPKNQVIGVFRLQKMMTNVLNGVGVIAAGFLYKYLSPGSGILLAGLGMISVMFATLLLRMLRQPHLCAAPSGRECYAAKGRDSCG